MINSCYTLDLSEERTEILTYIDNLHRFNLRTRSVRFVNDSLRPYCELIN